MFQPGFNFEFKEEEQVVKTEGLTIYLEKVFEGEERSEQERRTLEYLSVVRRALMDEANYIDHGGAAKVYQLGNREICVKIMKNRHASPQASQYNLGASPLTEFKFMELLHGHTCSGIRTPIAEAYIESGDTAAIVMEKLNAVNLQHILNGKEGIPEKFDVKKFFTALDEYINTLHSEYNIAHMDLYPRNIMIDRETGEAYVIDLGRAERIIHIGSEERQKRIDHDFDRYDEMYLELEKLANGMQVKKEFIPGRHEVHQFSRHTKVHLAKDVKREAIKIAEQLLMHNRNIEVVPLGKARDLFISTEKSLVVGAHHIKVLGVDFYIGIKRN